jgi:cyclophilin family peptidyl-prolyl cis-trans isomerase/TolA-binding protein
VTLAAALILSVFAPSQDSEPAKKAREELARIRSDVEKLLTFRERLQKNDEQFRAGAEDEEKLKQLAVQRQAIVKEFQDLRAATIRAMDVLLAGLNEEVKKAPEDAGLRDVRSEANLLYDRKGEALPDLEKLAQLRPDDLDLALKLGRLQHSSNRYEAAVQNLERYLKKDPAHVESRTLRAMCCFALQRFPESIEAFEGLLKEALEPQQKQLAEQFLKMARGYVALWKAEQAARAREEKADDLPRVRLTTSRGEIDLELFENEAPNTVANFVELVAKKYYDGLTFHRVIPGFMAQGGCPKGDGTGDPGYRFKDEIPDGYRRHFRGSLSMANSGPDTNGSQFFLTHLPTEWLNGRHTVFGRVLKGQEVVDALEVGDKIEKAEVVRKRPHDYKVEKLSGEK